ncbi:hypothetical protein B938_07325 [Bacillus velezensis AS43.3]|nr:hypothetical protein B938_07325 [Bacillus velezensis AS43.3]ODB63292.1 hypothetical protein A7313_04960 [Bacillus velezensis]
MKKEPDVHHCHPAFLYIGAEFQRISKWDLKGFVIELVFDCMNRLKTVPSQGFEPPVIPVRQCFFLHNYGT